MAAPVRRTASTILWQSPDGQCCSLVPMSGGRGLLEVELQDDIVAIHSRNCLLTRGDDAVEAAEFECTLALQRCQIDWQFAELAEGGEIERSQFFQR